MATPWRDEAAALDLTNRVHWHGALPAAGVAEVMRRSHVFCLPSVRESGGAVLLEAMACARPVIGLDFGGPAEVVDETVGWKVAMPDEATAIDGLALALREAWRQPDEAARRGQRARQRVLDAYTWAAKLDAAEALYARLPGDATRAAQAASEPVPAGGLRA